jgi:Ca-activated chloride channel family protein
LPTRLLGAIILLAVSLGLIPADAQSGGEDVQVNVTPCARPGAKPGEAAPAALPNANIRVDTNVVLVPVNVTDPPLNRFVAGLEEKDFRVFEDGVEQKIISFGNEDAAQSIGIVFDISGSMGSKLSMPRLSVAEFFRTANPEDEAFLIAFVTGLNWWHRLRRLR